jgi:hypothetical protein
MPTQNRKPFPRNDFFPNPNTMTPQRRLVYLIETRKKLQTKYRTSYHNVIKALELSKSETDPAIASLTPEQRTQLQEGLLAARDDVARGFTQTIILFENTINELAPGTYPRGGGPLGSFDLGEWFKDVCDWLADLIDDIADVFDDLGMDSVAAAMHEGADAVEWVGEKGNELLHPDK